MGKRPKRRPFQQVTKTGKEKRMTRWGVEIRREGLKGGTRSCRKNVLGRLSPSVVKGRTFWREEMTGVKEEIRVPFFCFSGMKKRRGPSKL